MYSMLDETGADTDHDMATAKQSEVPAAQPILIEIDSEGDVILETQVKHFRVESKMLTKSSAVFNMMLSGAYLEAGPRSALSPIRIPLDDSPSALHCILSLLHFQHCPDSLYPLELITIAMTADKYQLAQSFVVQSFINLELMRLAKDVEAMNSISMQELIVTSVIIRARSSFKELTAVALNHISDSGFGHLSKFKNCIPDNLRVTLVHAYSKRLHMFLNYTLSCQTNALSSQPIPCGSRICQNVVNLTRINLAEMTCYSSNIHLKDYQHVYRGFRYFYELKEWLGEGIENLDDCDCFLDDERHSEEQMRPRGLCLVCIMTSDDIESALACRNSSHE